MDPPTLARRELLRLAGGALWLPLGASIASPLVALAASGCEGQAPERLVPAPAAEDAPRTSRPTRAAPPGMR